MKDSECVDFLQWALPCLRLRWAGFRKVRRQVCRRVKRRIGDLGLSGFGAYREFLERHPQEWPALEKLLPITISRFYRDIAVWDFLWQVVLAELSKGRSVLRAWSIGCASGEEPYSLALAWRLGRGEDKGLRILATDINGPVMERARVACYSRGTLKQLPERWVQTAFGRRGDLFCLRCEYRSGVELEAQDVRRDLPDESFHLILCRNLVFTYFDRAMQRQTLGRVLKRLEPRGALVIGSHESLPEESRDLCAWPGAKNLGIYRKAPSPGHDPDYAGELQSRRKSRVMRRQASNRSEES